MSALPRFQAVCVHPTPLAGGVGCESQWLAQVASTGIATAHLWHAPQGLVATRSYERLPRWEAARRASAEVGWPVEVRASGGGLVPQGPGLLNVTLLWRGDSMPGDFEPVYVGLCDVLAGALAMLGIVATPASVPDSFCDGRFNLAVEGRKVAGTAQAWKKIGGQAVVLAHAVVLVEGNLAAMCDAANTFEAAAGSGRRYRVDALTSVELALREGQEPHANPMARLVEALQEVLR